MRMRSRSGRPLPYPVRFAVLGGGSFGLALASVLGTRMVQIGRGALAGSHAAVDRAGSVVASFLQEAKS